jgi:enoyl-CoA hydratase/carnithine racemase
MDHTSLSTPRVTVSIEGGVADVRLNRPDKITALDLPMLRALVDTGETLKDDPSVRVVVLSGEGRGFCAGLDFGNLQAMAGGDGETEGSGDGVLRQIGDTDGRATHLGQQAAYVWQELDRPVVAAVHGVALGGGCQIALGADIRIIAPDTRFSLLEIRWGLVPDMTGTALLPLVVGLSIAKELIFTGRMVAADEALRLGLATRVSDTPREDALALAREITCKSPDAIGAAKTLLNRSLYAPLPDQFLAERQTIRPLIGSNNQVEAMMAYFEERTPEFDD